MNNDRVIVIGDRVQIRQDFEEDDIADDTDCEDYRGTCGKIFPVIKVGANNYITIRDEHGDELEYESTEYNFMEMNQGFELWLRSGWIELA